MRKFWKQRGEDEIERLLREHHPEPRDEFVTSLLARLETPRQRLRPQRLGRRILVAACVTALVASAGVAAGATHVAGTSISSIVHVGQSGNNGKSDNGSQGIKGDEGNHHGGSGDHQYTVEICHHTHSATNPWVDLFLSPQGAANHLKHHPMDFLVDATHPCPPVGG